MCDACIPMYTLAHPGKEPTVNHTAALVMDDIATRCSDDPARDFHREICAAA